eukprot:365298-Chlamydomonas_euryale.AAC.3
MLSKAWHSPSPSRSNSEKACRGILGEGLRVKVKFAWGIFAWGRPRRGRGKWAGRGRDVDLEAAGGGCVGHGADAASQGALAADPAACMASCSPPRGCMCSALLFAGDPVP